MEFWKIVKNFFQKVWFDVSYYNKNSNKWLIDLWINTVIDVWANEWQYASEIHSMLPQAKIYSFEPIKNCFDILSKTINWYWEAFNYWLWEENKEVIFYHNESSASSSILKMNDLHKDIFTYTKNEFEEKIYIKKLDDIKIECNSNILLKIDVQWYEKQVLEWWINFLKKVKVVTLETNFFKLYEWAPLFNDIYIFLLNKWFTYSWSRYQLQNPNNWEILQQDAIFIRK